MQVGVHLPQVDLDGSGLSAERLTSVVTAARNLGYAALSANDHFDFAAPWLDGLMILARASADSGDLELMTSVALPSLRHPVPLAAGLAALARLAAGPVVAGIGPGSSATDQALVGLRFADRWRAFDATAARLRELLHADSEAPASIAIAPTTIPIWVASWGSRDGLRRVARLGDGWMASAYNSTPAEFTDRLSRLGDELVRAGRSLAGFPHALVTMWLWLCDDQRAADRLLAGQLPPVLGRDPAELRDRVCIGTTEHCIDLLGRYAAAGCERVHVWPVGDEAAQLARFAEEVLPKITAAGEG
jgi:alkanesulfonate monooxygenase SsuD/methylene tetrahydromethanopterin reductase-like flavin-dependent oxidoreductase (luciferase family)